jgi:hypothetical protein
VSEHFVHILNWPVDADSDAEAARQAYESIKADPTGFFFSVTTREIELSDKPMVFDSYDFEESEKNNLQTIAGDPNVEETDAKDAKDDNALLG